MFELLMLAQLLAVVFSFRALVALHSLALLSRAVLGTFWPLLVLVTWVLALRRLSSGSG